jgi:hypothetical protein
MTETRERSGVTLDDDNPWLGLHEFDERNRRFFNGPRRIRRRSCAS